ncbi:hypothetical protein BKA70DRAFT_1297044 [Coprinopsis sp. MPI-PUGE-AT-0042]|nr:hypothetical protein BKA70DRAFT_1297044 [Coprinopsis sp. MPI-PUGE-AT-0042]
MMIARSERAPPPFATDFDYAMSVDPPQLTVQVEARNIAHHSNASAGARWTDAPSRAQEGSYDKYQDHGPTMHSHKGYGSAENVFSRPDAAPAPSQTGRIDPDRTQPGPPSGSSSSYTRHQTDYHPHSTQLCVVCNMKPRHSSHLTCGFTCASKISESQAGGERSKGKSRLCSVCQVRPCATGTTGKKYPTCGFKCASKLPSPAQVQMCEFCNSKPRVLDRATGHLYPHCGRTCRDKAKAKAHAASVKGQCITCVVCWRKDANHPEHPVCGQGCMDAVNRLAPTLVEIPNGHLHFYTIIDQFKKQWDASKSELPKIRHIYSFVPQEAVRSRHQGFIDHLNHNMTSRRCKGLKRWMPISRDCSTGTSGITSTCSSPTCNLCNVILNGLVILSPHDYIAMFSSSSLADTFSTSPSSKKSNEDRPLTKAMILVDVASSGKEVEMTREQFDVCTKANGQSHNFVRIIDDKSTKWAPKDTGELRVLVQAAVLARYLVVYS